MTELSFFPPSTFDSLVGTYRRLLECNPGKAIRLSQDSAALLVNDRLVWAPVDERGCIDQSGLVPIDEPGSVSGTASLPVCEAPELFTYSEAPK